MGFDVIKQIYNEKAREIGKERDEFTTKKIKIMKENATFKALNSEIEALEARTHANDCYITTNYVNSKREYCIDIDTSKLDTQEYKKRTDTLDKAMNSLRVKTGIATPAKRRELIKQFLETKF
jgi:hypothetical protein